MRSALAGVEYRIIVTFYRLCSLRSSTYSAREVSHLRAV